MGAGDGIRGLKCFSNRRTDEAVSAQAIYVVERPDLWHAIVDMAVRRNGRPGRAGQPLFPHPRWQDRSLARLRAALGALQRLRPGLAGPAVMAWPPASHRPLPPHPRS